MLSGPNVSELDIWRSAQVMIREYGREADVHAALKADAMLAKGDLDGYRVWQRIVQAIEFFTDENKPAAPN